MCLCEKRRIIYCVQVLEKGTLIKSRSSEVFAGLNYFLLYPGS